MSATAMLAAGFLLMGIGLYAMMRIVTFFLDHWEFALSELLCGLILIIMSLGGIACGLTLCWIGGQQ
ncbi:MAG TPA: hypothetical protein VFF53_03500 [Geobacteraceae bacterium]|nr:hypothetical protein [Aquabacterium sp.]HZV81215.1 hypothetical protein [Geobacteraceae bacterium]